MLTSLLFLRKKSVVRKIVKQLSYEQVNDELLRLSIQEDHTKLTLYYYKLLQKIKNRHIKKIIKNPHIT